MVASKCVKEYMALYRQWGVMLLKNLSGTRAEKLVMADMDRVWKKLTPSEIQYVIEAKRVIDG